MYGTYVKIKNITLKEYDMKKLGFGIMGPGNIARKFAESFIEIEDGFIAAVASKTMGKAKEFSEKYHIPAYYDDYDLMCKDDNVDVVYISTTNNFHYENILTCINNNKHVLCEKPFVMTKQQAMDVFRLAEEKKVFVMEALWSRFLPAVVKAKELIDSNAIGDIKHILSSFNYLLPYKPHWRIVNKSLGGGVLYDLGIYCLSLSMFFTGEKPKEYNGYSVKCSEGTDIRDTVIMEFSNGITGSFTCSYDTGSLNEMHICGSKGSIRLNDRFHGCKRIDLFEGSKLNETFNFDYTHGFVYQIEETIKCINKGLFQSSRISWEDTLNCIEVIEQLLTDWNNYR